MDNPFPQKGSFWRFFGFTKTHLWGTTITSTIFCTIGFLLAAFSDDAPEDQVIAVLLFAVLCVLASCLTVLFSIMTLLFYIGSTLIHDKKNPVERSEDNSIP